MILLDTGIGSFFLVNCTKHRVESSKVADFIVDGKCIFVIGGENKSRKQILDQKNSFIVADEMELAFGNKIPLRLFGCLY